MKIAILVNRFPPVHLGGTEVTTYNIATELVKDGHEVYVLTSSDPGFADSYIEKGFNVCRFARSFRFFGTLYFWIKIMFIIKKINPDIIHAQSIDMALPAFIIKKILMIPYIVYSRCSIYLLPVITLKLVKNPLKNADMVLSLTEDMKEELSLYYNLDNIKVVPNGINLEIFSDILPKSKSTNVILCVAGLRPEKGLNYLIKAMEFILNTKPNSKLFLVGGGIEEKFLLELVKKMELEENIIFVGKVPQEQICKYYSSADVFVLPSLYEGFPVSLLEAMATGTPIVATDVCGVSEFVRNGRNGYLVRPKDPKEIAERVLLILENSKLRETISKNNLNDSNNYDQSKLINKLEKLYNKVLSNY